MELEKDDLREDLEAAFEQIETGQEGGSPEHAEESVRTSEQEAAPEGDSAAEPEVGEPGEKSADGRVRGPDGKFAKKLDKVVERPQTPESKELATKKPEATKEGAAAIAQTLTPAPISWKAGAKAEWAKIPRAAQEEIIRRETETSKVLSQTANARKHFDEFNQTVAPFMPLIRAQNSTPMVAFKNLMTTAAGLTIGSPEQKARIVAEMVANFGIDINTLDQVLSGVVQQGQRAPQPGTSNVEVSIQRALGPVYEFMNGIKLTQAQREEQMRMDAERTVEDFSAKNEFFHDLRDDIADLMEMAANRGRVLSIEDAYKRAVAANPEISGIVSQRQAAAKSRQNGSIQRARNAASTVSGAPTGGSNKKEPQNRRDEIAAAWDDLSNS